MFDILKQDAVVGDVINLYLTTGGTIKGRIIELENNYLLLEVDGIKRRIFPQLIGGWDVVKDNPHAETLPNPEEQPVDVENQDNEESSEDEYYDILISLLDNIYECEHITLSAFINTNASVDKVSSTGVSVIADSGETFVCHKGFMVGFSRANCTPGKRLFCGSVNKSGPQKGICFVSVLQMSYEEMRERFIQALTVKTGPRKPIINSIIAYFRKNNSGKVTKKIIADLRTKVSLLDTPKKIGNSQLNKYISFKQYDKAFVYIENLIHSSEDDKQKAALMLRRAQLYSSLKRYNNAVSSYKELVAFNEQIGSSPNNLSHLYTEIARLSILVGNEKQAEAARRNALRLNPQNSIAKSLLIHGDSEETDSASVQSATSAHSYKIVKLTNKNLVDEDIEKHSFTDSEIISLNGAVTTDIANRLLEIASVSDDFFTHLEAAKALKESPIGSYNIQDLEDEIISCSLCKCRSLFNSYRKVIIESQSIDNIALESLLRIKDCAIDYYLETIERINKEDSQTATLLLTECLILELTSLLLSKNEEKVEIENVFKFSLEDLLVFCKKTKWDDLVASLVITLVSYSIKYTGVWENVILKSPHLNTFIHYVTSDNNIKQTIIQKTPPTEKRDVSDSNFMENLLYLEGNRLSGYYQRLRKIEKVKFDMDSIGFLQRSCRLFKKIKSARFFNSTDIKTSQQMLKILSALSKFQVRDEDSRRLLLSNSISSIDEIIRWNKNSNSTFLGRFYFYPLLLSWQQSLESLKVKEAIGIEHCQLSVDTDSPFYTEQDDKKFFKVVIYNKSSYVAEGYKLTIWTGQNRNAAIIKYSKKDILPDGSVLLTIPIPKNQWGELETYEIELAIQSLFFGNWSNEDINSATISQRRNISSNILGDIMLWNDSGDTPIERFKGRDEIVNKLVRHYCSIRRNYIYVLYGLSRTGKSSILKALRRTILGKEIEGEYINKIILPLYITLDETIKLGTDKFWDNFWEIVHGHTNEFNFIKNKGINIDNLKNIKDFDEFINELNAINIHPLIMFDEFSYMQKLINAGVITSAFLQHMKTISADKDQASFIFAGTYDIDSFIQDPKYNISGAFVYLDKIPIFEISKESAEELIGVMSGKIDFTPAAIRNIHKLTGDVPFWIQKLCLNCAFYAVEYNTPIIGTSELEKVVGKMTGEFNVLNREIDITTMNEETFNKTLMLETDTDEMKVVLSSIAHLLNKNKSESSRGICYEQIKDCWTEYGYDISNYDIKDAIDSLCERKTLLYDDIEERRYYRFSIDLFRRWWYHKHYVLEPELSKFLKKNKI